MTIQNYSKASILYWRVTGFLVNRITDHHTFSQIRTFIKICICISNNSLSCVLRIGNRYMTAALQASINCLALPKKIGRSYICRLLVRLSSQNTYESILGHFYVPNFSQFLLSFCLPLQQFHFPCNISSILFIKQSSVSLFRF